MHISEISRASWDGWDGRDGCDGRGGRDKQDEGRDHEYIKVVPISISKCYGVGIFTFPFETFKVKFKHSLRPLSHGSKNKLCAWKLLLLILLMCSVFEGLINEIKTSQLIQF